MPNLRIALISDLHVGRENRGLDMCPHILEPDEITGRNQDYVATFETQAGDFLKNGPIDILCVTGDISNRAHADEFVFADRAIRRIAAVLSVSDDAIYFVPGNHDIHWPVMGLQPTSFWSTYRYAPLFQEGLTFQRRVLAGSTGAMDKAPYFVAWHDRKVIVIGINSAAFDGPESQLHGGLIRQETVDAIDLYLATLPRDPLQVRMCLLHHHPIQYSERVPDSVDPSIAVNSENLLRVLTNHSFDLVLHGHKHQPRLKTHLISNGHPYVSLCAGSFSAVLHPLYFDGCSNLFHVVNIRGRDNSSQGIKGTVQSWTHVASGKWEASNQHRGIPAIEAFGSMATPAQIKVDLMSAVSARMSISQICRWQDLLQFHPHLEYVRAEVVYDLLSKTCTELGFELAGDNNGYDRSWVVFRRTP